MRFHNLKHKKLRLYYVEIPIFEVKHSCGCSVDRSCITKDDGHAVKYVAGLSSRLNPISLSIQGVEFRLGQFILIAPVSF